MIIRIFGFTSPAANRTTCRNRSKLLHLAPHVAEDMISITMITSPQLHTVQVSEVILEDIHQRLFYVILSKHRNVDPMSVCFWAGVGQY